MTRTDVVTGVRECVARVVDRDLSEVSESHRIIGDLGADSLDLLDLVFQLEQRFDIKISPRGIERRAKELLGDVPLEVDGVYTPEALAQLREVLPEVPAEEFADGLGPATLPRVFRVATFVNLTMRLLEEGNA
jgi:acyl carrier protein